MRPKLVTAWLHNLARDPRVFIIRVHGTKSMVPVSYNNLSIVPISNEEDWRKGHVLLNLLLILLDMRVADAEQRQLRSTENVFGFELSAFCGAKLGDKLR